MELFSVKLPSHGIPYGIKEDSLKMGYTTGEVESVIASITESNFEEKSYVVLKHILHGIDPKQLTLGDRQALLVQNTINSYTKYFPMDIVCQKCGAKHEEMAIDLTQINFNEIEADDFEPRKQIEIAGKKAFVKLYTLEDEIDAEKNDRECGSNATQAYLYRMAKMVDIVKYRDDAGKETFMDAVEKFEFLKKCRSSELRAIKSYGEKYMHGNVMTYKYKCEGCDSEGVAVIPFLLSLLLPAQSIIDRYANYAGENVSEELIGNVSFDNVSSGEGVSDLKVS